MMENKISLVIGADGMIGRSLADRLTEMGERVLTTTRRSEDISNQKIFLDLSNDVTEVNLPDNISVVYLCAAVTGMDACRKNPSHSETVNVHNAVLLAEKLLAGNAFVIFLSTSSVYDGSIAYRKAESAPCPLTEYGRQKAETERQLLGLGDNVSVVRLTKVVESSMHLFGAWIQSLNEGKVVRPFSDMAVSPVPLHIVVNVLYRVAKYRLPGIIQVSGERDVTYAEIAFRIAQRMGVDNSLVQPVRSKESNIYVESVPSHTTLDTDRLRNEIEIETPDVMSTIDSVIDTLMAKEAGVMQ